MNGRSLTRIRQIRELLNAAERAARAGDAAKVMHFTLEASRCANRMNAEVTNEFLASSMRTEPARAA